MRRAVPPRVQSVGGPVVGPIARGSPPVRQKRVAVLLFVVCCDFGVIVVFVFSLSVRNLNAMVHVCSILMYLDINNMIGIVDVTPTSSAMSSTLDMLLPSVCVDSLMLSCCCV